MCRVSPRASHSEDTGPVWCTYFQRVQSINTILWYHFGGINGSLSGLAVSSVREGTLISLDYSSLDLLMIRKHCVVIIENCPSTKTEKDHP